MYKQQRINKVITITAAIAVFTAFGTTAGASAHTGEFAKFDYCPSTNPEFFKCISSVTTGGQVVLGEKTVPIVNPVTLQGGFSKPTEFISKFFEATNGVTLSNTPQPVPGGLVGLVPPEESPPLVREALELVLENGLTGVNSTLELAQPASNIQISEHNLIFEEGVALKLPVKIHLENPFLGSNCYVGSSSSPIIWNLTTGETTPPAPNEPIHGKSGEIEFKEEGAILELVGSELVDNAWAAPQATGCGGVLLEALVNPIIDSQVGLPAASGYNTAELQTTSSVATAKTVNLH
jgi:hypothetical protein